MTIITCELENCIHNKKGKCKAKSIELEDQGMSNGCELECHAFGEKEDNYGWRRATTKRTGK